MVEHFERFFTPVAKRPGAWYYYIPVLLAGLIPWMPCLFPALRDRLRGGPFDKLRDTSLSSVWAARDRNADAWFLVTWVGFIFLFFSKSQSKLVPYILPVFPALAVIIGAWLADVIRAPDGGQRLRNSLRAVTFLCGLLAFALVAAVLAPRLVKLDAAQAVVLRPLAFLMAGVLVVGGIVAPLLARIRGAGSAVAALAVMMAVFFGTLLLAAPVLNKPSTQTLAQVVVAQAKAGDRVYHYHGFFHDFTFYAQRPVGLVDYKDELELEEDAAARASGRFINEAEFRRQWNQGSRLWVVAKKRDVKALFADATFRYHLLGETEDYYLFSNQP